MSKSTIITGFGVDAVFENARKFEMQVKSQSVKGRADEWRKRSDNYDGNGVRIEC